LFLLVGVQVARLRTTIETSPRRRLLDGLLGLALGIGALVRVGGFVGRIQPKTPNGAEAIVEAIANRIRPGSSQVVMGAFNPVSPYFVSWAVLGDNPRAQILPDPMTKTGYSREAFREKIATLRRRIPALGWLEPGGEGPIYRIAYVLPKRADDSTDAPQIIERMFRFDPDRVLVLAVGPGSPWNTKHFRLFNHPGTAFLPYLSARPDLRLTEELHFPGVDVRLMMFDRQRKSP